jgi:transposase InsO family protein
MDMHKNARLAPRGRALLARRVLEEGWSKAQAAAAFGVSAKTAGKWIDRFKAEGEAGMADRSSKPNRSPQRTAAEIEAEIIALRRQRRTGGAIAQALAVSPATVSRVLKRHRLSRARDLDPPAPILRYERARPGELIHIDIKKLGRIDGIGHRITGHHAGHHRARGAGWECVHVAIDDNARVAFTQILPDEKKESAVAFLEAALAFYARLGVTVERVMTDNGSAYRSKAFAAAVERHGLKHIRTRPYTPKTNGKAERLIQTCLREWAYACAYQNSAQRAAAMPDWLHRYNWHRPHSALKGKPPASRLGLDRNNLLRLHS